MALHAESSPNALRHARSKGRLAVALYGCAELVTVLVGVLGLLGATWPRRVVESGINIHVLFTLLLCGLVLARYLWRVRGLPRILAADARELSRHLSRRVYLLLYIVLGVRQSIGIISNLRLGSAVDFKAFDLKDDFELFLGTGLFTLVVVRVLAFSIWLRLSEIAVAAQVLVRNVCMGRAAKAPLVERDPQRW